MGTFLRKNRCEGRGQDWDSISWDSVTPEMPVTRALRLPGPVLVQL